MSAAQTGRQAARTSPAETEAEKKLLAERFAYKLGISTTLIGLSSSTHRLKGSSLDDRHQHQLWTVAPTNYDRFITTNFDAWAAAASGRDLGQESSPGGLLSADRLLLGQLRHNQEIHVGEVLGDALAVSLLGRVRRGGRVQLSDLAAELRTPLHWLALGKLLRAELIRESGDSIYVTAAGRKNADKWRRTAKRATRRRPSRARSAASR